MSDARRRMPVGLCDSCVHQRLVPTRRSVFSMCEEPRMPRYPAVPVMRCPAYSPRATGEGPEQPR